MKKNSENVCVNLWSVLDQIAKGTYKLPLYNYTPHLIRRFGLLHAKQGPGKRNRYRLVKRPFAKGKFGSVHRVKGDPGVVVKVVNIKAKHKEVAIKYTINEVVIQSLLYCVTQLYNIPAIHFLGQVENTSTTIVMGMESVGGSEYKNFEKFIVEGPELEVLKVFVEICDVLQLLQKELEFMHRDLHGKNIMLQYDVDGNIRPMLIDFGYSSMKLTEPRKQCLQCRGGQQTTGVVARCPICKGYNTALRELITDAGNNFGGHSACNKSLDLAVLLLNCEYDNELRKNHNREFLGGADDAVTIVLDRLIGDIKSRFSEEMTQRVEESESQSFAHALYHVQMVNNQNNLVDMGTSPEQVRTEFQTAIQTANGRLDGWIVDPREVK